MFQIIKIILLGIIGILIGGISFGAYTNENLYCSIKDLGPQGKTIKISLNKDDGGKCIQYIKFLEQKMKNVYKDILTIQGYINTTQDVAYRRMIKNEKTALLNDLQKRRLNILINMRTFERNLVEKSKELFLEKIEKSRKKLESGLIKLESLSGSTNNKNEIEKYLQLTKGALNAIKNIENAKTFTMFNEYVKNYIYFARQLEGK